VDCEGVGGHRAVGVLSLIGFALMLRCVETGFARRASAASSSGAYVAASLVWQSRQR
jgi:drug/metabolite transporter superfamily protein YnfA